MADNVRDELAGTLKNIFDTGDYLDLVITCKGDTYNVHKAIVCARSGFFKNAIKFPGKESEKGKIDLPEDEAAVVKLLIEYLYEGEYDPKLPDGKGMENPRTIMVTGDRDSGYNYGFPHSCHADGCSEPYVCQHHNCGHYCNYDCKNFVCESCCPSASEVLPPATGDANQLLLHAKTYEIGDKYDVVGLKQLAREKFLRACAEYWDSEHFAPAAHCAFITTPEEDKGLRDIISSMISTHMVLLKKPAVEALLTEFNSLAVGLLKMRAKDIDWI